MAFSFVFILLFGLVAGYGINRTAMLFARRYTGDLPRYGGLFAHFGNGGQYKADMIGAEVLTALITIGLFLHAENTVAFWFELAIVYDILLLALIDLRFRLLPNLLTLSGAMFGVLYVPFHHDFRWEDAAVGAAVGAGIPLVSAGLYYLWRREEGLGMGDVKLLVFFGTFAGWKGVIVIIMAAALVSAVWGMIAALLRHAPSVMRYELPFGPFLGGAALLYIAFF